MRIRTLLAAGAVGVTMTAGALAGPMSAAADEGPTFPPRDERCKVPPLLFQVAAVVDPDSLEGCGFFEDPNYHENRKDAGIFVEDGIFTRIFG